jgi:hypothetical protein
MLTIEITFVSSRDDEFNIQLSTSKIWGETRFDLLLVEGFQK